MPEAVIVAAGRTPIGRANKGSLADMRGDDLAGLVIRRVLDSVPEVTESEIDDVIVGCGQPAGEQGFNIARVAAVLAGLNAPGVTVNRYCSSSLQAMRMAMHAIRASEGDCFIAAGVESSSKFHKGNADNLPDTTNPRFDDARAHTLERAKSDNVAPWTPVGELPDIYIAMGQTAENVADAYGVSRAEMDEFAFASHQRAVSAQSRGHFDAEIVPVTKPDGTVVSKDDGPRADTSLERLATLSPVFRSRGAVTAGNACPLNDGAAAVVVMSERRARDLQLQPLARIVATGVSALEPELMGMGPVEATRQTLKRAGMTLDDVDLVEINEAFAAQVIPCARELGIDSAKLNVNGGAIALGHPFGMTGARIMTTLLNNLRDRDLAIGLETMCVGGGQGMAILVERLS